MGSLDPARQCELGRCRDCQRHRPHDINPAGAITGGYQNGSGAIHGFLRTDNGTFTTFDVPGGLFIIPYAINPAGVITGTYEDASPATHGFVRASNGAITPFDDPDADPSSFGTFAGAIDAVGAITGTYYAANFVLHGFLRAPEHLCAALRAQRTAGSVVHFASAI